MASVRIDTAGEYVRRDMSAVPVNMNGNWTMCCWIKRMVDRNAYSGVQIMHALLTDGGMRAGVYTLDTNDTLVGYHDGAGGGTIGTIPIGTWRFVGYKHISGDNFSPTAFSALIGDSSLLTDVGAYSGVGNGNYITLGAGNQGTDLFNCSVAQCRIWTSNLSDAQLITEKNSSTPVITSGLYLAWPLNGHTDTSDTSGNSRPPTMVGAGISTDSDSPPNVGGAASKMALMMAHNE